MREEKRKVKNIAASVHARLLILAKHKITDSIALSDGIGLFNQKSKFQMDYELYHDESKVAGYWHGMLLVPVAKKEVLLSYMKNIRDNTNYHHVISLKRVREKSSRIFRCARAWLYLGIGALIQDFKNKKFELYTGKSREDQYTFLKDLIGSKFILFREKDNHKKMISFSFHDYAAKVETTFRMGLKGGIHYLGSEEDKINIIKIHFDGYEHHSGRHIDRQRIIDRIQGLREYCSFDLDNPKLIEDGTSNHFKKNCQSYDDCQLLQLTDLIVSGFRTVLGEIKNEAQFEISKPLGKLARELLKGYARMKNSRWFNSICISQCYLENGQWKFETIKPISYGKRGEQGLLFEISEK